MIPGTLDRPLKGTPYAVLDFETTGVDPRECWPLQWAVVHGVLGEDEPAPVVYGHGLIAPPAEVVIPEEAARIHGIRRSDLTGAPSLEDALPAILDALDGRMLIAYNLPYDFQVLATACERTDRVPPAFTGLDPLVWARKVSDSFSKNKLSDLATRYKLEAGAAHDARGDVMTTARLLRPLLRDFLVSVKRTLGEEVWRSRTPAQSLRSFCEVQAEVARVGEAAMSRWFKSKGKPWADHPWHELTGVPTPMDIRPASQRPPIQVAAKCKRCGAELHSGQRANGSVVPLEMEAIEGVRLHDNAALPGHRFELLHLESGEPAQVHVVPADHPLRPGDQWVRGWRNHWWHCPKADRRTA